MNNNKIDGPDYYRLADGTFLEDALWEFNRCMPAPIWDACVYLHRAGHKDGEPFGKDFAKVGHYVQFYAKKKNRSEFVVMRLVLDAISYIYSKHGNPWEKGVHHG